ncbi:rhomboid family intramembrane serine protease [Chitinophaga silvatica]|uniref:Rhomboid family intramembrane serine protease n=1 Tax=Chitinophaga silvatica TaxID=2282649 RepID=A0A3E1YB96_9BACT|nr:rhomboid family intramembrane serine protease [Chitinophaga silvatica]RFS23298.1 rhomboid family intramembrane serine protease [Chitinophaga silvatica]
MNEYRPGKFQYLPLVIKNLMIINGLVWLVQITLLNRFGYDLSRMFGLHYWGSDLFRPYQFITHLFLHDPKNFAHVLFNMFTLWMFGATLENLWGPKRFLIFYLVCGLGAALCHMGVLTYENLNLTKYAQAFLNDPNYTNFARLDNKFDIGSGSSLSMEGLKTMIQANDPQAIDLAVAYVRDYVHEYRNTVTIGASGAVYGILFAFGFLFPNAYMYLYFLFPIKAKYVVAFLIVAELWSGIQNSAGDNVAHFAHLGGVLFAFLLLKGWSKRRSDFY